MPRSITFGTEKTWFVETWQGLARLWVSHYQQLNTWEKINFLAVEEFKLSV